MNFWNLLPRPFTVLAPMEDVTDTVFRRLIRSIGGPDLFYSEFTSSEGLMSDKGRSKVAHRLEMNPIEKPIVAQIWGKNPEAYAFVTKFALQNGFDGIDINMGCAVKKIIKQGCCSALMNDRPLASEIIQAVKENAGDKPVSVKTRLGFNKFETENWIPFLLEHDLDALAVHGRTVAQKSKGESNWSEIAKVVKLRDEISKNTVIVGNGDITTRQDLLGHPLRYGVDGVMVGRGIFADPWIFTDDRPDDADRSQELLRLGLQHVRSFREYWGERKNSDILKRYMKIYIRDLQGGSELRVALMRADDLSEMEQLLIDQLTLLD